MGVSDASNRKGVPSISPVNTNQKIVTMSVTVSTQQALECIMTLMSTNVTTGADDCSQGCITTDGAFEFICDERYDKIKSDDFTCDHIDENLAMLVTMIHLVQILLVRIASLARMATILLRVIV